ncbi:MAG TPA: hypothetical protein VL173_13840 [Vicinamibacterales bacterium]|nr:hypothetical protein [Vicinamibacterales bacterium]
MAAFVVYGGLNQRVRAQQITNAPAAMVGVTGTVGAGGRFAGTFLLTRFDSRGSDNRVLAVGSIDGVLNGRSVVTPIAVPVTLAPASTTAVGTAPSSCDAIHMDLAAASFQALGSVVTLDTIGFDIAASQAAAPTTATTTAASPLSTPPATPVSTSSTTPAVGTATAFPSLSAPSSDQAGTPLPTSPVGSVTPGVISPAPVPATTSPQQFTQLLCSVSSLSQTGSSASPAQMVPLLNQVLAALRQ